MLTLIIGFAVLQPEPDCGGTTSEIGACFSEATTQAEVQMEEYFQAARNRLSLTDRTILPSSGVEAAAHLENAQRIWLAFRDAECDAVYSDYSEGTFRNIAHPACRLHMTNERTHEIWERWLTFHDGSTPILPEPKPIIAE